MPRTEVNKPISLLTARFLEIAYDKDNSLKQYIQNENPKSPNFSLKAIDKAIDQLAKKGNWTLQPTTLPILSDVSFRIKTCLKNECFYEDRSAINKLLSLAKIIQKTVDNLSKLDKYDSFIRIQAKLNKRITLLENYAELSKKYKKTIPDASSYSLGFLLNNNNGELHSRFRTFLLSNGYAIVAPDNYPKILKVFYGSLIYESAKIEPSPLLTSFKNSASKKLYDPKFDPSICQTLTSELAAHWNAQLAPALIISLPINKPLPDNKELAAKILWDKHDGLFTKMLSKVPAIPVNGSNEVRWEIVSDLYNNYGLQLDRSPVVRNDSLIFHVNGEEHTLRAGTEGSVVANGTFARELYKQDSRQLFSSEKSMIMCDVPMLPKEPFGPLTTTLCDGCGWGMGARQAALTGSSTMQTFTEMRVKEAQTLKDIASIQIDALLQAHQAIATEQAVEDGIGTTTVLQATIVGDKLVATSLGDCKLFLIRMNDMGAKTCFDLTADARNGSVDATDPGGRIGARFVANQTFIPQINNLSIAITTVNPGDIILLCSDGLGDLLDPECLGLTPGECGLEEAQWNKSLPHHAQKCSEMANQNLLNIIEDTTDLGEISKKLQQYAARTTQKYLTDITLYPNKNKFLRTKKEHPGKPDHVSFILARY